MTVIRGCTAVQTVFPQNTAPCTCGYRGVATGVVATGELFTEEMWNATEETVSKA